MSGTDRDDDGFLTRWSRRKQEAAKAEPPKQDPVPAALAEEERGEEPFDPEKLPIPLPSLEDLKPGDSLVAFMQKGVPDFLRNAALRKMWVLDPMVRDFKSDALDYAWDWNTPGGVPGAGPLGAEDKVEEMVEALFRTRQPEEKPIEAASDLAEVDKAAEPEAMSMAPLRSDDPEPDMLSPSDENEKASPAEDVPRRRHGGAMPQV